jgi:hypothetical protein
LKIVIFILLIYLIPVTKAQDTGCSCELKMGNEKNGTKPIGKEYIEKYLDNPILFFHEWSKGDVISTSGEKIENKFLAYNILLDEIICIQGNDDQKTIPDRRSVKEFTILPANSRPVNFVKTNFKNRQHPENNSTYMQLLYDGNTGLYKYIYAIEASYTGIFYRKETYFLLRDGTFRSFPLRQKGFIQLFGDNKKQIKQIFRNNHLSIKKEDDLIRGIELYNTFRLN